VFNRAIDTLRARGAIIVDPADIPTQGKFDTEEHAVLLYEFKDGIKSLSRQPRRDSSRTRRPDCVQQQRTRAGDADFWAGVVSSTPRPRARSQTWTTWRHTSVPSSWPLSRASMPVLAKGCYYATAPLGGQIRNLRHSFRHFGDALHLAYPAKDALASALSRLRADRVVAARRATLTQIVFADAAHHANERR